VSAGADQANIDHQLDEYRRQLSSKTMNRQGRCLAWCLNLSTSVLCMFGCDWSLVTITVEMRLVDCHCVLSCIKLINCLPVNLVTKQLMVTQFVDWPSYGLDHLKTA